MSNLSNKDNYKTLKNYPNLNDINSPTNEFVTKRKRLKLKSNKINRRTLFLNKNKFLMEEPEKNKENEIIIKSNDFFSRKNDHFYNYIKKLKNNYMNSMKISSETNKDLFFNRVLDFKPLTDRNKNIDISERGFMLKKDYELNNLIIKKNKRAKTCKAKRSRIDKCINVMEYNLNQFFKSENNNLNDNIKFNSNNNINNYFDLNNIAQSSSASYLITDLNEEDIISKKRANMKLKNKARAGNMFSDITHKMLFIDNKNNCISKDIIINLLKEEENLIIKKIKNDFKIKNFSKFIETKEGRKIILPILYRNIMDNISDEVNFFGKENIGAFLTSINKDISQEKDLNKKTIDNLFYLKGKRKTLSNDSYHILNNIINNFNYKNELEENKEENNPMPNTTRGYENEINFVHNMNTFGINKKNKTKLERNKYGPVNKFKILKLTNLTKSHEELKKSMILNKNKLNVNNYKFKRNIAFEKNKLNLAQDRFNRLITLNKKEKQKSFNKSNHYIYYNNVYLNFNFDYLKSVTNHKVNLNEVNQIDNLHYFPRDNKTHRNREKALKKLFEHTAKRNFNKIKIKINDKGRNKAINEDIKIAKTTESIASFKQEQKDSHIEVQNREKSFDDKSSEKNNENEMKENNSNLDNSQKLEKDDSPKIIQNNDSNLNLNNDNNSINMNNNLNKKIELNENKKEGSYISNSEENNSGEEESEDEKNEINHYPKKLPLLIKFIKDIIIKERKKQEFNNYNNMKEESKKSYEMFKKQIDLADKAKKPKLKRLFSEMHYSNREEHDHKIKKIPNSKLKNIFKFKKEPKKKEIVLKDKTIDEDENKISKEEKNQLLIDEINLINEIKIYMSTIDDPENQKKFENLLKQIESYKKMDDKDYIKKLKENFGSLKEEISDRFRVKEIEDRINGFVNNLDKDIDKFEVKRSFYNRYINIVDHKFKSTVNQNF